jgi:long-chain acyl-CoA synthetase
VALEEKKRMAASQSGRASGPLDTFPRLLLNHAVVRGDRPATREKYLGIWQTWNWSQVAEEVRAMACGLAELGFKRGDNLAIIGDNRPRLYWAMCAAQMLGGVPVPLYQDAVAAEMAFVLTDGEIRFAIVEDQEQVDKMLEIKDQCPSLAHILYDDPRGMRHYTQTWLQGLDEVIAMGRVHDRNQPDFILGEIAKGRPEDVAVMLYTSGTTGKPKGVCQTHETFIAAAQSGVGFDHLTDQEDILSYLPMAWVGDHLFSYAQALVAGFTINCPESGDTVMTDLREIGPTYYFAPPRVFENLLTTVMIRMEDAGALKRGMFHYFMAVAKRCGADILDWQAGCIRHGPPALRAGQCADLRSAAQRAGHEPHPRRLHGRCRHRPRPVPFLSFHRRQPEAALRCDRNLRCGLPATGSRDQVRQRRQAGARSRGQDRRQRRSAGARKVLLKEYYKRPADTAEAIDAEGWFHTGDAGFFDEDGHLKIIDRAKDVGKLSNAAIFAPNYIENKLKFFPHIKEAVCFGHDRDMVCAFINIDMGAVGNWAERRGLPYSGYTDLAGKAEVLN